MLHPAKIEDEVRRLAAQAESDIATYIAEYDTTWQKNRENYKWVAANDELNDSFERLENLVGPPGGRSEAALKTAVEEAVRADLTATSSQTMADTRTTALNAKRKLVLGRTGDTHLWAEYQRDKPEKGDRLPLSARMGRRLNTAKWSVPVNYAFMDGGIAERAAFKIVTDLGPRIEGMLITGQLRPDTFWQEIEKLGDSQLWAGTKPSDEGGPKAMLGHEILQLIESDYRFYGRKSTYARGNARLVALHPDGPVPAAGDKTQPITLP
ncbi:hypothetical protein AB0D16_18665 [Streptomyces sp. NPDC048161]|uniref:hypothetical protein n=1 Tax=Streptomyces sp. NPDC048161 TaxID=3160985 RepID=UPI0033E155DF